MRILLVGPSLFLPWTPYCARALERLGHSVETLLYSDIWLDRLTLRRGREIAEGFPPLARQLDRWREQWHRKRDGRLLKRVKEASFDLILVLRGETLSAGLLKTLRKRFSGLVVTWWVDDPFRHAALELLPYYDTVFIFDRSYIAPLKERGVSRVEFLPCACDETIYHPQKLSRQEEERYRSDIALVAWYYPDRAGIVQALADLDLKVWGKGWKNSGVLCRERFVPDEEVAKIYNAASIGLNIHSDQSHEAGLNSRAFELLAAGTFELTDYVPGMEELLVPEKEVAVYRSPQEARERAEYFLKRPEERLNLAQRGQRRVLGEHTYLHRMRTLLQSVSAS